MHRRILDIGMGAVLLIFCTTLIQSRLTGYQSFGNQVEAIGVLPVDNLTGDPQHDFFAGRMHNALITALANQGDIRVVSRYSMQQYLGSKKSMPAIAKELQVDALIESSILGGETGTKLQVRMIGIHPSEHHLYSDTFVNTRTADGVHEKALAQSIALSMSQYFKPDRNYMMHPEKLN